MSLFSRSRSKGHYPRHNHGGGYYKRSHGSKGILGRLFTVLFGIKRHSYSYLNHGKHYINHKQGFYSNRRYRKSSWS